MFYLKKNLATVSAAHRIQKGYNGKCRNLHGHNYEIEVVISSQSLNGYDFVMDFGDIKDLFDKWLKDNLDHSTLVYKKDSELLSFLQESKQKHYLFDENTSAEIFAKELFYRFNTILKKSPLNEQELKIVSVTVFETASSSCTFGNISKD